MARTKRDREDDPPGDDWQAKLYDQDVLPYDWARAGCAADAVVKRAHHFALENATTTNLTAEAILAQHVKVQLAYLNMRRTVNLSGNVDGDIRCYLNNPDDGLDVNLSNKDDKAFTTVIDGTVAMEGSLEVFADNRHDDPFKVKVAKS